MKSSEITRKAKSNLAFALNILPKERRDDMVVFYAYSGVIDDIADEESRPVPQRKAELADWREGLASGFMAPTDFQKEVIALVDKYQIPVDLMTAIINGCEMDTEPLRFRTWEDLQGYTWKVACAVGLISLKLFGANDPKSESFAVALGHALQLTNIMRDIGEDAANNGRIYLPLDDLAKFSLTEADLLNRCYDARFTALMQFEYERCHQLYETARTSLPASDRKALVCAEVMREIYHTVLTQMKADQFRVFDKRYSLSTFRKMAILAKHMVG
ncbi:MAG TPA: squalene synthase HpnD [Verrucomicrobiales bacterium]|nr:squalene synthase HpnD [Verrucomicrobiales bacterium]